MPFQAKGTFDVKLNPESQVDVTDQLKMGRLALDKQFHGDLQATSQGQMLTAMTGVEGSAVYVAIEAASGTLQGRQGKFMLHHTGIMNRGEQQLSISVVPDSGTDELVGLAGTMLIDIVDGKHSYTFEYTLGD